MPLTPADVHNVAFSKPPIGKRGYNEDEVDTFLDLVEDALAQLQDENDDLSAQLEELKSHGAASATPSNSKADEAVLRRQIEAEVKANYEAKLKAAQDEASSAKAAAAKAAQDLKNAQNQASNAKPAASGLATADTHMQAAKVLGLAQEMADRLTNEAKAESESMLSEARSAAEKQLADADNRSKTQLAEAQRKCDAQLADADTRSKKLISDAEAKAKQTETDAASRAEAQIRQAEEKAAALQADAERKHTEIMNTVKQQQTALEARISDLRTFEREYRTRLKTLLTSQLEELDSRGFAAPNGDADKSN